MVEPESSAVALARQPNGKILTLGSRYPTGSPLERFNADGTRDSSFGGGDGIVGANVGTISGPYAMTLQPDGKIVVGGHGDGGFTGARYDSMGNPDMSFGVGGVVTLNLSGSPATGLNLDSVFSLAMGPGGRILAAGSAGIAPEICGHGSPCIQSFATVLRFRRSGELDSGFSGDGIRKLGPGGVADVLSIGGGRSLVAAYFKRPSIGRLTYSGTFDRSFGSTGVAGTGLDGGPTAMAVQSTGRIVAVGSITEGRKNVFGVARLRKDGCRDRSFGRRGVAQTVFGGSAFLTPTAVALARHRRIIVAGAAQDRDGHHLRFALARFYGGLGRN